MILSLTIESMRGQTATYQFGRANLLMGRNGTGKSTIREALCYGYAGTDSSGNRSPTHLITRGERGLKLTIKTERSELTRTLTQEGSQTRGLTVGGVRTTPSQEVLSQKLGSTPDVFLSVLTPGYFMRLPPQRQHAVLTEVLPPIDRRALLTELAGLDLPPLDPIWTLVDLTKRADLAGTRLTQQRRLWQSQLDQGRGRLEAHRAAATETAEVPVRPDGIDRLPEIARLRDAWRDYGHRKAAFDRARTDRQVVAVDNEARHAEEAALRAELAATTLTEVRPAATCQDELQALLAEVQELPARPAVRSVPGSERCPACGQAVGSKHRDQVAAENAKAEAAYAEAAAAVERHNGEVRRRATAVQDRDHQDAARWRLETEAYAVAMQRRMRLEAKLAALGERPLPDLPPEPTMPGGTYDEKEEVRLRQLDTDYQSALRVSDHVYARRARAAGECTKLEQELAHLGGTLARAQQLEDALQRLPQEELARQSDALSLSGYRLDVGDAVTISRGDGAPYPSLSSGERMRADIALSRKINDLLRGRGRPAPGVIFIDDADLVDDLEAAMDMPGLQVFAARVVAGLTELKVEAHA